MKGSQSDALPLGDLLYQSTEATPLKPSALGGLVQEAYSFFGDPKTGTPLMQNHPLTALDLPLKAVA